MRTLPLIAPVLLALAPVAWAGDAANPEITDAANDAGAGAAWGDVTAAWWNDTALDIVVTLQLASLTPAAPEGYTWYGIMDVGSGPNSTFGCFAFQFQGAPQFGCSHWDRTSGPVDNIEGTGTLSPGQPGTVTLNLPKLAANATPGIVLSGLSVGTGTVAFAPVPLPPPVGGVGTFVPDDAAQSDATYTVAAGGAATPVPGNGTQPPANDTTPGNGTSPGNGTAPPPTQGAPAQGTPGVGVAALGLAGSAAALAARRRR